MNGTNLLLDTNIIIYYLQGDKTAYDIIANNNIFSSVIKEMELLSFSNFTVRDKKLIYNLLSLFSIIAIENSIKNKAIDLRKRHSFKLPDAIIVASTIHLNCSFVTADRNLLDIDEISGVAFDI